MSQHPLGLPDLPGYKRMTSDEIVKINGKKYLKLNKEAEEIIRLHKLWLDAGRPTIPKDEEGEQASFFKCDLRGADLCYVNIENAHMNNVCLDYGHLYSISLKAAFLCEASICYADLECAHLEGADLREAKMTGANMYSVHLEEAFVHRTHLEGANLIYSHMSGANMYGAILIGASLNWANLAGAYMREARLEGADMRLSSLEGAILKEAFLEGVDASKAYFNASKKRINCWDNEKKKIVNKYQSFSPTNIEEASMAGITLKSSIMSDVDLRKVKWQITKEDVECIKENYLTLQKLKKQHHDKYFHKRLDEALKRLEEVINHHLNSYDSFPYPKRPNFHDTRLAGADMRGLDFGVGTQNLENHPDLKDYQKFSKAWWRKVLFEHQYPAIGAWCFGIGQKPLYLDETLIERTRFDREVNEPWHILKREYSGYKFFLILLFVALAFLPYIIQGLVWINIGKATGQVKEALDTMGWEPIGIGWTLLKKQVATWQGVLSLFLLAYSAMRAGMTLRVNDFFRHEVSTGFSPPKGKIGSRGILKGILQLIPPFSCKSYGNLFLLHWYVMRPVFILSVLIGVGKVIHTLLFAQVWAPS